MDCSTSNRHLIKLYGRASIVSSKLQLVLKAVGELNER